MKKHILSLFLVAGGYLPLAAQYTIYPVPQAMTAVDGTASFSGDVCLVCDEQIDAATRQRARQVLEEHGLKANDADAAQDCTSVIYLKVDPSVAVSGKYDAHHLRLEALSNGMASLTITGQHTDATFMGLASLEQMLDAAGTTALPCVDISDYADQQQRGLVEGYYGYPYSQSVKKDLMRFMMRLKMNTYLYGAKSDPYHSEYWGKPYPQTVTAEQEQNGWLSEDMMRDVCETSAATKVNFIWAIHPGNNFLSSNTVIDDIMGKFEKMHALGVRQFGVFVDDVSVPSSDADLQLNAQRLAQLQERIEQQWNAPGAVPSDTVRPLHFVPQIYCRSFASSEDQYQRFFKALATTPENVVVYTTGWGVWSVPNSSDFAMPEQYLGREVAWWWNYPCNDNADDRIYPMDMYQNFSDMSAVDGSSRLPSQLTSGIGIVANPMQQGEVAKIPLFSVADYAWNNAKFVNKTSWAAAFPFIFECGKNRAGGDRTAPAEALKALAPYLTANDPSGKFGTGLSTSKMLTTVTGLLENVEVVKMLADSETESDRLLWRDLRPWVLKLETMLNAAKLLLQVKLNEYDNADDRWKDYLTAVEMMDGISNNADFKVYALEGMGTGVSVSSHIAKPAESYLMPFLTAMRKTAVSDLFPSAPTKAARLTNTTYVPSVNTSGNDVYITLAAKDYAPGDYVGFSLPKASVLSEMLAADTLCQNNCVLVSANGREWTQILPSGSDVKQVEGVVKYLIVANSSDAVRSVKLTKNVLRITLVEEPSLTGIDAPVTQDYNERAYISDDDLTTFWSPMADQSTGDVIRLNYSSAAPLRRVRFALHTTNGDYMKTGRIECSENGTSWKRLAPVGKQGTSFTLADMTPVDGSGNALADTDGAYIYQLYFDGALQQARYVRFYNQQATANKWIRVAEFTPEFALFEPASVSTPEISDAQPHTSATASNLRYGFQEFAPLTGVTVYSDGAHPGVKVYGSDVPAGDDLDAYREIATLDAAVTHIDLTATPYLHSLMFVDDSGNPFRVYEVVPETADEVRSLHDITSVEHVVTDNAGNAAADAILYDLSGRRATGEAKGCYICRGKKIMK